MRQAGRYLPEYRKMRSGVSFLELCKTPSLAAEVTLQPIRRFGFDAAILFSDLLIPLEAMGLAGGVHRRGAHPARSPVRAPPTWSACRRVRSGEGDRVRAGDHSAGARGLLGQTPLIGFAGAPFTVATYAIEGKTSKRFIETKKLFYRDPAAARRLLALIGEATRTIPAGAGRRRRRRRSRSSIPGWGWCRSRTGTNSCADPPRRWSRPCARAACR